MRRAMMVLAAAAMLMVGTVARAQMIDPTTGVTVDAASDPTDFFAVASGQPGNIGEEISAQTMEEQEAASAQNFQDFVNASMSANDTSTDDSSAAPAVQDWPITPKPTMTPNGGKVVAGGAVALHDADPNALLFYTTDGTKPTEASEKYTGPFVVAGKEKVEVLAFDLNDKPSGVVSKTFEVKK